MSEAWNPLGRVEPAVLEEARLALHFASQIVSGVGRTWVPGREDDSHTSLMWLPSIGGLVGQRPPHDHAHSPSKSPSLTAGLDFAMLRLIVLDQSERVVDSHDLKEVTFDEGCHWLAKVLASHWGRDFESLAPFAYAMPEHGIARGEPWGPGRADDRAELARWFGNASIVLGEISAAHGGTPVRCWPHHFDIATLLALGGDRTIGIGMSPGDESYAEPYWYVGPWPNPSPAEWPDLAAGHWHTKGFVAGVLEGTELVGLESQYDGLKSFLESAIGCSRKLLLAD